MNKLTFNPSGMIRRSSHASTARRENDQGKVCILCGKTDIYMSQYGNVYNIGLGLITQTIKQYIIRLNVSQAAEKRYLLLNNLHTALLNDPDLASVSRDSIGMYRLYNEVEVSTGYTLLSAAGTRLCIYRRDRNRVV